jgi:cell fate (sporulation/competence/biofilm development) regulator YlbF (YheA/YmcA/DUF963 family)
LGYAGSIMNEDTETETLTENFKTLQRELVDLNADGQHDEEPIGEE